MKIEKQFLEDHQAKLTVEVEAEQMESMKRRAARKVARRIKIPGFRPGKAPYPVILRQVGEGAIVEQALEILVEEIYPKVIDDAEITPYGPGKLENVSSLDPPVLEFIVPLESEITLGDYRSIQEPYEPEAVDEAEVDKVLENLRERQAVIEPVERPAQDSDMVNVRLSATRTQVETDQDPVLMAEQTIPFVIAPTTTRDDDSDDKFSKEWPFRGFSRHLLGLSADDELDIQYSFPEDADAEKFRGENVEFHLVVETVKAQNLPDLDDEFAASMGDFDNLEALRSEILSTLVEQSIQNYNAEYDEKIIAQAIEESTIKFPPQMLEREIESVISNLENRLNQQGLDMDLYLKTQNKDMDGLREEMLPIAETRLKQTLFLLEFAKAESIQVDQDEVQAEARSTMNYLTQSLPKREARKLSERDLYSALVGNILTDKIIALSMQRLRDICSGKIAGDEHEEEMQEAVEAGEEESATDTSSVIEQEIEPVDSAEHEPGMQSENAQDILEEVTAEQETEPSEEHEDQVEQETEEVE